MCGVLRRSNDAANNWVRELKIDFGKRNLFHLSARRSSLVLVLLSSCLLSGPTGWSLILQRAWCLFFPTPAAAWYFRYGRRVEKLNLAGALNFVSWYNCSVVNTCYYTNIEPAAVSALWYWSWLLLLFITCVFVVLHCSERPLIHGDARSHYFSLLTLSSHSFLISCRNNLENNKCMVNGPSLVFKAKNCVFSCLRVKEFVCMTSVKILLNNTCKRNSVLQ